MTKILNQKMDRHSENNTGHYPHEEKTLDLMDLDITMCRKHWTPSLRRCCLQLCTLRPDVRMNTSNKQGNRVSTNQDLRSENIILSNKALG